MRAEHLKKLEKEMLACTRCGYCRVACPTLEQIGWDSGLPRARVILAYGLLSGDIEPDDSVCQRMYQCTTCANCEEECPSLVRIREVIEAARADIFQAGGGLEKHRKIVAAVNKLGNPFGEKGSRLEKVDVEPHQAEVGYFMGCMATYRELEVALSTLSILKRLDIDFTVADEKCCGSVLGRVGADEGDIRALAEHNIDVFRDLGVKTLLFSCAGCYRMFKEDYGELVDVPFELMHITEFLAERELDLEPLEKRVTYHDPCHIGRHLGVYDAPRELIRMIPGIEFVEMPRNRENALCCGGGGGVRAGYPELATSIGARRVRSAGDVDIILTACPFCVNNMRLGSEGMDGKVPEVMDLVVLLARLLK